MREYCHCLLLTWFCFFAFSKDAKCDFITQFYGYYLHEAQVRFSTVFALLNPALSCRFGS
jgi:hypothetical protein